LKNHQAQRLFLPLCTCCLCPDAAETLSRFQSTAPAPTPSIRIPYAFTPPTLSSSSVSRIAKHSPNSRRHSAAIGQLRAILQFPPPTYHRDNRSAPSLALSVWRPPGAIPADPGRSSLASWPSIPPLEACVRSFCNCSVLGGCVKGSCSLTLCASRGQVKLCPNR